MTPVGSKLLPLQSKASFRLGEIGRVNLKPDKVFHATALRGDGRISDSEERIEHRLNAGNAVQLGARFG